MPAQTMLIIHHDPQFRQRLRTSLQDHSWSTLEADHGTAALDLAARRHPDVILLDAALPTPGADVVAKQLKTDPMTCVIPIIAVSTTERAHGYLEPWAVDAMTPITTVPVLLAKFQRVLAYQKRSKPFVLVVDDEPDLVEILTAFLQERGFAASGAANGAEAMDVARTVRPDAILLDLDMPQINGWEFLYRMKVDAGLRHVRVVILTGKDQSPADRQQGLSLGASEYLLKPCPPEEIARALHAALGQSREEPG